MFIRFQSVAVELGEMDAFQVLAVVPGGQMAVVQVVTLVLVVVRAAAAAVAAGLVFIREQIILLLPEVDLEVEEVMKELQMM
jgi:hypothetical protein